MCSGHFPNQKWARWPLSPFINADRSQMDWSAVERVGPGENHLHHFPLAFIYFIYVYCLILAHVHIRYWDMFILSWEKSPDYATKLTGSVMLWTIVTVSVTSTMWITEHLTLFLWIRAIRRMNLEPHSYPFKHMAASSLWLVEIGTSIASCNNIIKSNLRNK